MKLNLFSKIKSFFKKSIDEHIVVKTEEDVETIKKEDIKIKPKVEKEVKKPVKKSIHKKPIKHEVKSVENVDKKPKKKTVKKQYKAVNKDN